MSFPSTPSNGQSATVNGITYQWNSTKTAWVRVSTGGTNLLGNTMTLNGGASSTGVNNGTLVIYGGEGVTGNLNVGGFITGNLGFASYETITKNLNSYPYTINYSGTYISNIVYTVPGGTITKTYSYGNSLISSVALTGSVLPHVFTKNLVYTGNSVTSATYTII